MSDLNKAFSLGLFLIVVFMSLLLAERCVDDCVEPSLVHYDRTPGGPEELSSDDCEARRVREASVGSTREDGGNNLYQPITVLDKSSSSNRICATPMKLLWSMRP